MGGWAKCVHLGDTLGAEYFLSFSPSNATCGDLYLAGTSPKILYWDNHSRLIWSSPSSVCTAECMDVLCYIHRKNLEGSTVGPRDNRGKFRRLDVQQKPGMGNFYTGFKTREGEGKEGRRERRENKGNEKRKRCK